MYMNSDSVLSSFQPYMRFEKTHSLAQLPKKNFDSDSGWDLFAVETTLIQKKSKVTVPVGLKLAYLEPGYWLSVGSRSGLSFKYGILAHPGIIDQNYRGDLGVLLYNHGDEDYTVNTGDRIAQLILHYNIQINVEWGTVQPTDRGGHGFGSSGK